MKKLVLGVVAVAAWAGAMLLLASWSETDTALAAAAIVTVALGVTVGSWWALLAPAAPTLYLVAGILLSGSDDRQEVPAEAWALYVLCIGLALAVLVALGVWLRRLVAPPARPSGARPRAHG